MINIKMEHAEMGADGGKTRNPRTELKKGRGLPKNIRQVGDIPQGDRIYIEDYVVTYLNQLAHPANRMEQGRQKRHFVYHWCSRSGQPFL